MWGFHTCGHAVRLSASSFLGRWDFPQGTPRTVGGKANRGRLITARCQHSNPHREEVYYASWIYGSR